MCRDRQAQATSPDAPHGCQRGSERLYSMKTVTPDFFSKKYSLYINAFLRRRTTEKTTDFTLIRGLLRFRYVCLNAPHARLLALTEGVVGAFTMGFFVVVLANRLGGKAGSDGHGPRMANKRMRLHARRRCGGLQAVHDIEGASPFHVVADGRQAQHVALALVIALGMSMLHLRVEGLP